jgi:hypothetical protein
MPEMENQMGYLLCRHSDFNIENKEILLTRKYIGNGML